MWILPLEKGSRTQNAESKIDVTPSPYCFVAAMMTSAFGTEEDSRSYWRLKKYSSVVGEMVLFVASETFCAQMGS